jgi:hypothetical protein
MILCLLLLTLLFFFFFVFQLTQQKAAALAGFKGGDKELGLQYLRYRRFFLSLV